MTSAPRARFVEVDRGEELLLGLRPLGFPTPAGRFIASSLVAGHLLVSGVEPGVDALLGELLAREPGLRRSDGDRAGVLLLSGRLDQLKRLGLSLQQRLDVPAAPITGGKILRACFHAGRYEPVRVGALVAGAGRTLVMGIVNVTPDSFSDGGRFVTPQAALDHATRLVAAGADLLDVGGESTRPKGALYGAGAGPVDEQEELARVVPVIEALVRALPATPISIDTSRAAVALAAIERGAVMVNDVRGLADDALAAVVRDHEVACCLMHRSTMPSEEASWEDVVGEVADELCALVDRAEARGVPESRLLVDPGLGFGKSAAQNLFLLRQLPLLRAAVGRPLLVGSSRKGFLGAATGRELKDRDRASAAATAIQIVGGAAMVRVHEVDACIDAVRLADAVALADVGGSHFEEAAWD